MTTKPYPDPSSYTSSLGLPTVNWPQELHNLRQIPKEEFDPQDAHYRMLLEAAAGWEQDPLAHLSVKIPRWIRYPKDEELERIAMRFYRALKEQRWTDCEIAMDDMDRRAEQILNNL